MKIPLVPIVQNCAVPPLVPVRRAYEFGRALGEAIRSYTGLQRVALVGAGGLSHWIGNPRVGDIEEDFDRWFLERLERGELDQVLDITDSELELAGNGAHEIRSWLAVAGAVAPIRPRTLAYEPVYPWITGMAVAHWETVPDREQTSATVGAQDSRREESLT
jgi:aromatic ring-opening dioxygenase LigB subunit